MDILHSLSFEIYNNKSSYKEQDYIVIMNILKEYYDNVKGKETIVTDSKIIKIKPEEEDEDEDEMVDVEYSDSYLGDGYLSSY